jgi:hypothetical protein
MGQHMAFSEAVAGCAAYIKEHKENFAQQPAESCVVEDRAEHLQKIELAADRMARTTSYDEFFAELEHVHRLGVSPPERDVKLVALAHITALLKPDLLSKPADQHAAPLEP